MTASPAPLTFAEFPAADEAQWRKLVERTLKGASADTLVARTADGLAIDPLPARVDAARAIAGRPGGLPWQILQRVDHPDPAAANAEALHDLENGANGLSLVFAGAAGAFGYGLDATPDAVVRALDGVYLDAGIAVELQLGSDDAEAVATVAALPQRLGVAPSTTAIRFAMSPLDAMLLSGRVLAWRDHAEQWARALRGLQEQGFRGPFAVADGRVVHNAGGSEALELATMLAVATAYLRALEAAGFGLEAARDAVFFRAAADADQFLTMAKLRALRQLWARVEQACGLAPQPAFVSAETSWRMMTRRDPYANMLRITIAAAAAGLGGADAVTVLPFAQALGLPDRFARRNARNTQLVLIEESNLARVSDPAAGAAGIEDLTRKLGVAAWALFQEIEAAGGAAEAIAQGLIQRRVAAIRAARTEAFRDGREHLIGTTVYPNAAETPVTVLDVPARATPGVDAMPSVEPLAPIRFAAPFEQGHP